MTLILQGYFLELIVYGILLQEKRIKRKNKTVEAN